MCQLWKLHVVHHSVHKAGVISISNLWQSVASFLADDVDEVEALAEEELDCPVAVLAAELHALAHVARHQLDPVRPRVLVVYHLVQAHDHVLQGNSMLA